MKQGDLFGFEHVELGENEKKYSKKVETPVYEPRKDVIPSIYACYDSQKYYRLIHRIDNSSLSEEEKTFLRLAAARFVEFNFETIADYYATAASKEMQEHMEKLALVIIDFNKAIEDGFVQLNDSMKRLYEQELEETRHG